MIYPIIKNNGDPKYKFLYKPYCVDIEDFKLNYYDFIEV
jgi:hypothetical protein